jgi:hypothetical protein
MSAQALSAYLMALSNERPQYYSTASSLQDRVATGTC